MSTRTKSLEYEEESNTADKAKANERFSLDSMFERCTNDAREVAREMPEEFATEIKIMIRRIEDSHCRLQIWGSDMGADGHGQFTFDGILALKNTILTRRVSDILDSLQQQFMAIEGMLKHLMSESKKAMYASTSISKAVKEKVS